MSTFQFVTDISASPTLRLNINDGSTYVVDVGRVDLDPPEYDQGWADNPMLPGSRLTRSQPKNRTLTIPVHIVSTTAQGQAVAIENLTRELARRNFLKVQFANTNPIYFRTFIDPKIGVKIRRQLQDSSTITLQIPAEPYGYGPRVEVTGSEFTVANDPALSNGLKFDITGVLGDAPTPLLLQVTSLGSSGTPSGVVSKWTHIATRRRGTPGNLSNVVQAENMLASTDTTSTIDANMSGGNKMRVSFATNTSMTVRLSDSFPDNGIATVEARGLYRVYARVQKTVAGDNIAMQLRYGTGAVNHVIGDTVTLANTTNPYLVDLGYMPVPAYSDPESLGFSGTIMKAFTSWWGLYVQRVSGTGQLDIDFVFFMPADEPTTVMVKFPVTDTRYVFDGTHESGGLVYGSTTALDEVTNIAKPPEIIAGGGFPELIPGQTNRIFFLRNVDPNGSLDALTNTTTLRAYYWPRWREPVRS